MKASELRIGNKLYRGNSVVTVKRIIHEDRDILILEDNGLLTLGYTVTPIPLSHEILEKCGFATTRFQVFTNKWHIGSFQLDVDDDMAVWVSGNDRVIIYHLHQLQNLYYALTGEELNYQP